MSVPDEVELREADEAGHAESARLLGELLEGRGDLGGARAAYGRAESRGDGSAVLRLAALLEDRCDDVDGALAAYRRADAAGSVNGSGNLGRLLRDRHELTEAEAAFRRAVERGSVRAVADLTGLMLQREVTPDEATATVELLCMAQDAYLLTEDMQGMGALMLVDSVEERWDADAVEAGFRRADERGSASGAWSVAGILHGRGFLAGAAEAFRRAADRGDERAWPPLIAVHLEWRDDARAEAVAREGDAAGVPGASRVLGMLLKQSGDARGAIAAYRRANAAGDADGALEHGRLLLERGELEEAEAALSRAAARSAAGAEDLLARVRQLRARDSASSSDGLWARAVRLELSGDHRAALDAYSAARRSGERPTEPLATLRMGEMLESEGDQEAESLFRRAAESPDADVRAPALVGIARFRFAAGDVHGGLAALRSIVETGHPDETPRAWRNIGTFLEDQLGDTEGARDAYRAAISFEHPQHSHGARVNLAQLLDRTGDQAGAERLFREVMASGHPVEAPRAHVLLGLMLDEGGNQAGALEVWEAVASDAEEWSQQAALYAGFVHHTRGDSARAASLFGAASALEDPGQAATAFYFLGLAQASLGDRDATRAAMQRAVELGTGDVQAEAQRVLSGL